MAAYVLVDVIVNNPEEYKEYTRQTPGSLEPFGGKFLVRGGKVEVLEGEWPTNRFVMIEFPSVEQAKAWWDSDIYNPIKELRYKYAESKMIVVEGV